VSATDRWTFAARRAVLPEGEQPAAITIEAGKIVDIESWRGDRSYDVDAGDLVLLPGLVDTHVHANEPGRTDWEGLATATRAAAAGGVTTIVDMPLNSLPPTTTLAALRLKQQAAQGQIAVDVAFWGGAIPGNLDEFAPLVAAGVCGFKAFACDSGVPEFPGLGPTELRAALTRCAELCTTLLVHAEDPAVLARAAASAAGGGAPGGGDARRYATWLAERPPEAEVAAIDALVRHMRAVEDMGLTPFAHVVHLSAAGALEVLRAAHDYDLLITAETCPHYLTLCADDIADGATLCKCAPPIREATNRERLWEGLEDGTIALIASDHSPSPPDGKDLAGGDFGRAWGGISSLGLGLSLVWAAARARGHGPDALAYWMAASPAALAGLGDVKGELAVGRDADFCLFDPDATWTVEPERLLTRHKITPYAGRTMHGQVVGTWLRGERIMGEGATAAPRGRTLARPKNAMEGSAS
jgi:allantoinase